MTSAQDFLFQYHYFNVCSVAIGWILWRKIHLAHFKVNSFYWNFVCSSFHFIFCWKVFVINFDKGKKKYSLKKKNYVWIEKVWFRGVSTCERNDCEILIRLWEFSPFPWNKQNQLWFLISLVNIFFPDFSSCIDWKWILAPFLNVDHGCIEEK